VAVCPEFLGDDERRRADEGEELFDLPARASLKYAAYVAAATEKLAAANPLLTTADRAALIQVCVDRRAAIWLPGSCYSRVVGSTYDVDVDGAAPVAQHPYRKSPQEEGNAQWHIDHGLKMGLLKPHVGSWATPAFTVKQKGKPRGRLVCDYRRINMLTKRMYHPMPRVDDTLCAVAGARWLSGLDAVSGFSHLPLSNRAKDVLAITLASGLYAWDSLPFGPADGPQAFQAVMRRFYAPMLGRGLVIYLDDLCVHSGAPPAAPPSAK
jgi:hypothetical protein